MQQGYPCWNHPLFCTKTKTKNASSAAFVFALERFKLHQNHPYFLLVNKMQKHDKGRKPSKQNRWSLSLSWGFCLTPKITSTLNCFLFLTSRVHQPSRYQVSHQPEKTETNQKTQTQKKAKRINAKIKHTNKRKTNKNKTQNAWIKKHTHSQNKKKTAAGVREEGRRWAAEVPMGVRVCFDLVPPAEGQIENLRGEAVGSGEGDWKKHPKKSFKLWICFVVLFVGGGDGNRIWAILCGFMLFSWYEVV